MWSFWLCVPCHTVRVFFVVAHRERLSPTPTHTRSRVKYSHLSELLVLFVFNLRSLSSANSCGLSMEVLRSSAAPACQCFFSLPRHVDRHSLYVSSRLYWSSPRRLSSSGMAMPITIILFMLYLNINFGTFFFAHFSRATHCSSPATPTLTTTSVYVSCNMILQS
jgi:hypothetical protein